MRSTFNILFYINKNKLKTGGTTTILCRITIDGSNVVMTTGESTSPSDWSVKRQQTNDKRQNECLQAFRERIEQGYSTLLFKFGAVSAELLKNHLQGVGDRATTLLALSREELDIVQSSKTEGTYQANSSSHRQLEKFIEGEGKGDIPLSAISMDFFDRYRLYLKGKSYAPSSINKILCWLSRLMYRAVSQQSIRYNPLEDAKYEQVERIPRYLDKADITRMLKMPFPNERAEMVRRMFLFSVFTGLAFADVKKLRYSDIQKNSNGIAYIRTQRQKTEVESLVPLHPIAEQILSQQRVKAVEQGDNLVFATTLSQVQIGVHLKAIGLACGIRQGLTFHMARHSFGTLTLEAGVSIESIAKMMGHASITSTQIYAQITDSKIAKDMDRLIEKYDLSKK